MDIEQTYQSLRRVLGDQIESFQAIELVEQYRQYFKPTNVKVVLLAESHVFTTQEDMDIQIPNIAGLDNYPNKYAKFVYCVGYGERLVTNNANHPKRDGTPQFWKILYGCDNAIEETEKFTPVLGSTPAFERLRNKINILLSLRDKGVWLVDTSIAALYNKGKKLHNMQDALAVSWQGYTKHVVSDCAPNHVICIGKGVASIVENELKEITSGNYSVVAQPNAFLSSAEHMANYIHYSRVCANENG